MAIVTRLLLVLKGGYLASFQDAAITIAINDSVSVIMSTTIRLSLQRKFTIETSH